MAKPHLHYARILISPILLLLLGISCKNKNQDGSVDQKMVLDTIQGFVRIFDGKTLAGWEGDTAYWRVEDGKLIGEVRPETLLKNNTFIIWKGEKPADFELKLDFRIAEAGNSGINYRSEKVDSIPNALRGYQADIDGRRTYTGQNYEERKRTTLAYRGERASVRTQPEPDRPGSLRAAVENNAWKYREILGSLGDRDSLKGNIKPEAWNSCHLVVKGNRMQHYINDILMSEVVDNDTINRSTSGLLGFQVHVGPPMKVEFRDILFKNIQSHPK